MLCYDSLILYPDDNNDDVSALKSGLIYGEVSTTVVVVAFLTRNLCECVVEENEYEKDWKRAENRIVLVLWYAGDGTRLLLSRRGQWRGLERGLDLEVHGPEARTEEDDIEDAEVCGEERKDHDGRRDLAANQTALERIYGGERDQGTWHADNETEDEFSSGHWACGMSAR